MKNKFTLNKVAMFFLLSLVLFSVLKANSQSVRPVIPSEAVISINGVPTGTKALTVEVTVDTSIVALSSSATSNVSGALVVTGSMSEGVGIIDTTGDLPSSFSITVPFTGVSEGTSMITLGMILDMIGGMPIANAIASIDVDSVTVSRSIGTFELIGPSTVVGPGKVAVAFSVTGAPTKISTATLNGSKVDFIDKDQTVGVAIIDIPASNQINLNLAVTEAGKANTVGIGSIEVSPGQGKAPEINSATVQNKSTKSRLVLTGKKLQKENTTFVILPTQPSPISEPKVKGAELKASFTHADCIPLGSYINISTLGGTDGAKIKVHGKCSKPLLE